MVIELSSHTSLMGPRPAPELVEWLMGLEPGWITDPAHGPTDNEQLAAP